MTPRGTPRGTPGGTPTGTSGGFYQGSPVGQGPILESGPSGALASVFGGGSAGAMPREAPTGLQRRTKASLVAVVATLVVAGGGSAISVPYAVLTPGPVTNTLGTDVDRSGATVPRIAVKGTKTYPSTGELGFTTVRVHGGPGYPVSVWGWVLATLDSDATVLPVDTVFPPDQSEEGAKAENEAEMRSSQDEATAVALRALGYRVTERSVVRDIASASPARAVLKVGDALNAVNGVRTTGSLEVRAELAKVKAGTTVRLGVIRAGKALTLRSGTMTSPQGRTSLGIALEATFDFPVTVTIDAGNVGGPSAGLMFTLGIYDVLTPGPLTGGKKIAGTGTITAAGKVGPIGGIKQKMVGARESGATYFLAPRDNCPDVDGEVPDGLTVVAVGTFGEARSAVQRISAAKVSGLPRC